MKSGGRRDRFPKLYDLYMSRTGQGIELMFLGISLGNQDVFINKAIAR